MNRLSEETVPDEAYAVPALKRQIANEQTVPDEAHDKRPARGPKRKAFYNDLPEIDTAGTWGMDFWKDPRHPTFENSWKWSVARNARNEMWIVKHKNQNKRYILKAEAFVAKTHPHNIHDMVNIYGMVSGITLPFFVQPVAIYPSLDYQQLRCIFTGLVGDASKDTYFEFTRNLSCPIRNDVSPGETKFAAAVTEAPDVNLRDFLLQPDIHLYEKITVLLLLFCGTFTLHDLGIVHNNLNFLNIVVERARQPQNFKVVCGESTFKLVASYIPKIYDYEFSNTVQKRRAFPCVLDDRDRVDVTNILMETRVFLQDVFQRESRGCPITMNDASRAQILYDLHVMLDCIRLEPRRMRAYREASAWAEQPILVRNKEYIGCEGHNINQTAQKEQ